MWCGTMLKNLADVSIKLHLNGAVHRDALACLAPAANAYEVRTYECDCGVRLTNVTQYRIDQHRFATGCRNPRLVGQCNLGDMGVQAVPRDFAFVDANSPQMAPVEDHIGPSVDASILEEAVEEVRVWSIQGHAMKLCGGWLLPLLVNGLFYTHYTLVIHRPGGVPPCPCTDVVTL